MLTEHEREIMEAYEKAPLIIKAASCTKTGDELLKMNLLSMDVKAKEQEVSNF